MPKKKKKSKKITFKKSPLFILNSLIAILFVIILAMWVNTFFNIEIIEDNSSHKVIKKEKELIQPIKQKVETKQQVFEEKTQAMEIEYAQDIILQDDIKEPSVKPSVESSVFKYVVDDSILDDSVLDVKIIKTLPKQQETKPVKRIPKLAIIIDDVTTKYQVKKIQSIGYPITMAFLPPTSRHPKSAKIAKNIKIHMIHLPLEAGSRRYEEDLTLHVLDSLKTIELRIQELKKFYPNAKYINNHTGSKFTANQKAMDKLLLILKKYNYKFLDSKTTAKSVAHKYAKKHNVPFLSRNIFLDNKQDKKYIQKQLQKAIKIARRDGSAIAIGHPHSITLRTLAQSKHLLKGLEVILINKLW